MAEIAAGRYSSSGKLPSEAQLVVRFGVSWPTIGRALKALQDQALIERRVGSGTFLCSGATQARKATPSELGLLIPGLGTTEIFELSCGELAGLARVHDQLLLWGGGSHPRLDVRTGVEQAEEVCELSIRRRVAGVFFAPFEHHPEKEKLNRQADRAAAARGEGEPDDPAFVRSLIQDGQADAIVCANDQTAATLIRTWTRADIRVPDDVRVTGFDDVRYATLVSTPLTTIHQPCRDLAEVAYRAMAERIAEPTIPSRTITITPSLIVRESCGAYARRPPASGGA